MKQEQLEQQAKAWMAVVEALNAACPGWIDGKESAQELAVKAISEMRARIESVEKDAARYREYKENSHIRFSLFSGRYRADNGISVLTDWIESFDECFDTAMKSANNGEIHA